MKTVSYLSPSAINLFYRNKKEYYLRYLSDLAPPREPQTQPMAIGSAFDAFVKSYLHEMLFGKGTDPKFDLQTLFECQVEPHLRDRAWVDGEYAFKVYQKVGALADLALELSKAIGSPQFEIELKGAIEGHREGVTKTLDGDVVLLGKPDVFYVNSTGCPVILDFKINGFYSKYPPSPLKGYLKLRELGVIGSKSHKSCFPTMYRGMMINGAEYLENLNPEWAVQLSIYAWLSGTGVGEDFVVAIDQGVCDADYMQYNNGFPLIKFAEHRMRINQSYQYIIFSKIQHVWEITHNGHYFNEVSLEESQEMCRTLDQIAIDLNKPENSDDAWFNKNISMRGW